MEFVETALFAKIQLFAKTNVIREELKGTNSMGQPGFCKNLRVSAVFCESLRFLAVFCKNLRFRNAVIPSKSENLQNSAKNCKFGSVCPF